MIASRLATLERPRRSKTHGAAVIAATAIAVATIVLCAQSASAATTIDGPIGLGTAATFGVLGASAVTNTGSSNLAGDLGVTPGSSITGFPPGTVLGTIHTTDTTADQAQVDTATAYDVAASLSPTTSGLTDLVDQTLIPGVYSGGALSLSGTLTLAGSASSVWVFQAASSLVTSSSSSIIMTGGASACNVFWQVGTSATLGTGSSMVGTVMALASITAGTGTTVVGRLLARGGDVTLDDTTLTLPSGCNTAPGTVTTTTSPTITSPAPMRAVRGVAYSYQMTAGGSPGTQFTVTSGGLAPGLVLETTTGVISGTPTRLGTYSLTVAADNGIAPPATASYRFAVVDMLAATGSAALPTLATGGAALTVGVLLALGSRYLRRRHSDAARSLRNFD